MKEKLLIIYLVSRLWVASLRLDIVVKYNLSLLERCKHRGKWRYKHEKC